MEAFLPDKEYKNFLSEFKLSHEIFHDLMQFKIREVLLVATIYDAYILEQEDMLTEKIFGEYYQLCLSNAPRITNVSSGKQALEILQKRKFDLVILTMRIDEFSPIEFSNKLRAVDKNIPILLLLNDNSDISFCEECCKDENAIDKIFVWNGDPKTFLIMNKYVEDKINVSNDTKIGMVRVILLVEDSIRYYSRYLQTLYTEIIKQTQRLIAEEHLDDSKKLLRMRSRPKILIVDTYEKAIDVIEKYKDYLLCVISDFEFPRENLLDEHAGVKLIEYIKKIIPSLPTLLQSSEKENDKIALSLHSSFIDKNSETLSSDLKKFILTNLGFGDFIFRNLSGEEISRAKTLDELKEQLIKIPDESLLYHAQNNHFSSWLMARGEIKIAKSLQKVNVSDFEYTKEMRYHLINICDVVEYKKIKGKIINFDDKYINEGINIARLYEGSLGGKGRGIAFLNTLIHNTSLENSIPGSMIKIPKTVIIGTEAFDNFMEKNDLINFVNQETDIDEIKNKFIKCSLPENLIDNLKKYLQKVKYPIAVRSSGLFEDSISQPFSGLYNTFIIPNNHPNIEVRLHQLKESIKLVYASIYSKNAKSYFEAVNYKIEEEKMAVVLQKVVGNRYYDAFYPHISGVAQSYNYYPFSYIKPADGIAVIAVGLGTYVVEGEKSYGFCPKYPKIEIESQEGMVNNTQKKFVAIDMSTTSVNLLEGEDSTLVKIPISEAEKHGTLSQCASVWDRNDSKIKPGLFGEGPRVINFAQILKYKSFPLPKIIERVLYILKIALGTPVEIEFAIELNAKPKPTFFLLQVKPFIRKVDNVEVEIENIDKENILLFTNKALGNGKIQNIYNIIYIDPDKFNKSKTRLIADEIEKFNDIAKENNIHYILMGPGRWGTRDEWLGIPVKWNQISNSKTIIEYGLEDFQIDPSLGSHFFHNITSMNIGYFSIPYKSKESFINWEWLKNQNVKQRGKYLVHVEVKKTLTILMDGRKQTAMVYVENK